MKQVLLVVFLFLTALPGFAQTNNILEFYAGAGASTTLNYNVGAIAGASFLKSIGNRTFIGGTLFYQGYAFLYDREANNVNNGGGNAGVSLLNKSGYIFIAPKISQFFGKHGKLEAYADAGPGFKMSGTETMRKWNYGNGASIYNYDSLINTSKNINSTIFRVGTGLTEYLDLRSKHYKWFFTITEDCGFVTSTLSKTSDVDDPSRTAYSPNGKLNPNYFSVMIGVSHVRYVGLY